MYDRVLACMRERYGDAALMHNLGDGRKGFALKRTVVRDDSEGTLRVIETKSGMIRIEFTPNLVEGIYTPDANNSKKGRVRLLNDVTILVWNVPGESFMYGIVNPQTPIPHPARCDHFGMIHMIITVLLAA